MDIKILQEKLDRLNYYDDKVQLAQCINLTNTFELVLEHTGLIKFKDCYQVHINHDLDYFKTLIINNGYIIQNIDVTEYIHLTPKKLIENGHLNNNFKPFIKCKIDIYPMEISLICEDIEIVEK